MTDQLTLRRNEVRQLTELTPKGVEELREQELDTVADVCEQFVESLEDDHVVSSLEDEEVVESVVQMLQNPEFLERDDVKKNRASWLAAKLARRGELSFMKMGFTTEYPLMPVVADEEPSKPENFSALDPN